MQAMATITSKRQLTIPVSIFKKLGFKQNQKVIVSEENGGIKVESAEFLVERLAGSIKVPKRYKGKNVDDIIKQAKEEYFAKKFQ